MRYFTAFLLFAISLFAQSPDVAQYLTFTAATAGAPVFVGAGGPNGSVAWRLTYYVDGTAITAAQVAIQGADAATAAGCSVGGLVWTTIITAGSSLVEVANPSASAPQGNVAVKSFYPCIRANVTAITGAAGTVKTVLYGYKTVWVFPTPAIVIPSGTQDVNLIQIDGTAVPSAGVLGALPVGGTVALNGLLSASAYPQLFAGEDYAATPRIQVPKVDSSGRAVVQGDAASGATAAGNPVKIGGVFNTTQPTVTNGQAVDVQATARGAVIVASGVDAIAVTPAANSTVDLNKVGGNAVVTGGVNGSQGIGGLAASGAAAAGDPVKAGGVFNTTQPTVTNGQAVDVQATARGAVIVASGVDAIAVTPAANSQVDLNKVGGNAVVTGGVNGSQGVGGLAASGAAAAGDPVKAGGVFNTTQPTVTNGQAVDVQATARGAVIVASGVDAIAVTPAANSTVDVAKVGGTATVNGGLAGTLGVGGGAATGAAPTTNPLPEGRLDSAGNLIIPDYCTLKATVSGATLITGSTQLVAVSALTTIRVCKWSFTTDTITTAQLVTGTGATCTTPTAETGVYSGAGGGLFGVLEEYNSGPLITTAAKTLCITLSAGVTTTGGITVLYSQR